MLTILSSCGDGDAEPRIKDPNKVPTQVSYDLVSTESKNGTLTYRMTTPLMERYELADEPFTEFTKGIKVETYNDSTQIVESALIADYAHYDETKKLWEARGNVVANNYVGDRVLYTEQLFWDEGADKIYSDKLVRVRDGKSKHNGVGFESDGDFNVYTFHRTKGQMEFIADTLSKDSLFIDTLSTAPVQHDLRPMQSSVKQDSLPQKEVVPQLQKQLVDSAMLIK